MLLLDSLDRAQLLFPGPLKRASDQAVLGFNSVILTFCPLGFIAGALAAQRPLSLKLSALCLQLPHRRESDRNLIRCQGIEEDTLDQRVNWQRSDFLTQRTPFLVSIGAAAINGVIAVRPGIAQAHATAATAADRDALQQSRALTWGANVPRLVAVYVVGHTPLVGHELLPADVTRVS